MVVDRLFQNRMFMMSCQRVRLQILTHMSPSYIIAPFFNALQKLQTISYGVSLTKAIRSSEIPMVRSLLSSGLHPNACNQFGESIVHAACRRGDYDMLTALLESQSSVQVTDDFGRTPLHDACWTSSPNFDSIRLLLDQDPWLLCIMDCRGSTPLGYVRKAHWGIWIGFLGAIADKYWPTLSGPLHQTGVHMIPPLANVEPNSIPLPDPKKEKNKVTLEIIELLANGQVNPQDLDQAGGIIESQTPNSSSKDTTARSRITFDPNRLLGSNATTMIQIGDEPVRISG